MKEAYIHLRVPAATKASWVRQSRSEGKKLTDWVVERIEGTMKKNAEQIIEMIREAGAEDDRALLTAMEDGEALVELGITDDDQESLEEAHDIISKRLSSGA